MKYKDTNFDYIASDNFCIILSLAVSLKKGTFAKVYLVRNKANKKIYSMKKLNKPFIKQYKQEQHTINERILLSKMDYPFLIKLFCCFQDQEHLYFIMEFIQGGELFFHLLKLNAFCGHCYGVHCK